MLEEFNLAMKLAEAEVRADADKMKVRLCLQAGDDLSRQGRPFSETDCPSDDLNVTFATGC
jgi:hypothetical protein